MASLVVIEDDQPIRTYLTDFFKEEGFVVQSTDSGTNGLHIISKHKPDLVILDLGLPDIAGEEVLTTVRHKHPDIPIIVLTAKSGVNKIVTGLNLGAADYLTKPFSADELLARTKARLRTNQSDSLIKVKHLTVNQKSRQVNIGSVAVDLTKTEFDLLVYLASNPNHILTRPMILNHVWGHDADVESRVVDVYIGYLRKKLKDKNSNPIITSKRGVGYTIRT